MTTQEIEAIFHAQTANVRELSTAWRHINRTINSALCEDNSKLAELQTRILGLVFCAYAEATFSKLIHTPHGFTADEIHQIKSTGKSNIVDAWFKCLEISTSKISSIKSNHVPNIKVKIKELIEEYIREPSLIRNKIAHGQWKVSLNSKNTSVNNELTQKVKSTTVIDLHRYKSAFDNLSYIIEDIIESPNKAHWKFYWTHVDNFENEQKKIKAMSLEDKIILLKKKKSYSSVKSS